MTPRRAALLLIGVTLLVSCGRRTPTDFTVSGKPIQYWLDALKNGDEKTRLRAVDALGNVGSAHADAIPALTDALHDSTASVRSRTALALLKSGSNARSAVPALKIASDDPDPKVREHVQAALKRIGESGVGPK
jgi:HEAT repeat protein